MPFEQRRAELIRNQPGWGDLPAGRNIDTSAETVACSFCPSSHSAMGDIPPPRIEQPPPKRIPSCKGWSLDSLLRNNNFQLARRVPASTLNLSQQIIDYDEKGFPLVVEGCHKLPGWNPEICSAQWLLEKSDIKDNPVRATNLHTDIEDTFSLSDFIEKSRKASKYVEPEEKERFYGKDLDCPERWNEWLHESKVVPKCLLPNDSVSNLLTHLPESSQIVHMMTYIGIGDTFTPSHKDLCASSGHNLMCYAEDGGSSFWFMTKTKDARKVAEYFHSKLKHELDHESHITKVEEFADAPFTVYVVEQKLGDLVLVPKSSCHQVVNQGGLTIKLSWSRMTLQGLVQAVHHELPLYRRLCRRETYRVRSTLYHTIKHWTRLLRSLLNEEHKDLVLAKHLDRAVRLFDHVLKDECVEDHASLPRLPEGDEDYHLQCDFCGADIFQSYFECKGRCGRRGEHHDPCILCPGCYAEGRSCHCQQMQPKQCQLLEIILKDRRAAIQLLEAYRRMDPEARISPFATEESIFKGGAFKAGCILAKQTDDTIRKCTFLGTSKSHIVPRNRIVPCKKCHHAGCFPHILERYNLHSIAVLLDQDANKDHRSHHQRHGEGVQRYRENREEYLKAECEGTHKYDDEVQLVNLALTFPKCRPYEYSITRPGWYDSIVVAPVIIPREEAAPATNTANNSPGANRNTGPVRADVQCSPPPPYVEHVTSSSNPSLSSTSMTHRPSSATMSSSSPGPSTTGATQASSSSSHSAQGPESRPKKRALRMDYVLVPALPFTARPAQKRLAEAIEVIEVSSGSESERTPPPRSKRRSTRPAAYRRISNATIPPSSSSSSSSSTEDEDDLRRPQKKLRKSDTDYVPDSQKQRPKPRPVRSVQSSNFTSDLASVINASAATSTELPSPSSAPSSRTALVTRIAAADVAVNRMGTSSFRTPPAVASLAKVTRTEGRPGKQQATSSSVSLGKRPAVVLGPDTDDDEPRATVAHKSLKDKRKVTVDRRLPTSTSRTVPEVASSRKVNRPEGRSGQGQATSSSSVSLGKRPAVVSCSDTDDERVVADPDKLSKERRKEDRRPPSTREPSSMAFGKKHDEGPPKGNGKKGQSSKSLGKRQANSLDTDDDDTSSIANPSKGGQNPSGKGKEVPFTPQAIADMWMNNPQLQRELNHRLYPQPNLFPGAEASASTSSAGSPQDLLTSVVNAALNNKLSQYTSENLNLRQRNKQLEDRVEDLQKQLYDFVIQTHRQQQTPQTQDNSALVSQLQTVLQGSMIQNQVQNTLPGTLANFLGPLMTQLTRPAQAESQGTHYQGPNRMPDQRSYRNPRGGYPNYRYGHQQRGFIRPGRPNPRSSPRSFRSSRDTYSRQSGSGYRDQEDRVWLPNAASSSAAERPRYRERSPHSREGSLHRGSARGTAAARRDSSPRDSPPPQETNEQNSPGALVIFSGHTRNTHDTHNTHNSSDAEMSDAQRWEDNYDKDDEQSAPPKSHQPSAGSSSGRNRPLPKDVTDNPWHN